LNPEKDVGGVHYGASQENELWQTDANRTVLGVFTMTVLGFSGDEPSGLLPEVLLLKIFLSGLRNFKFPMVCLLLFVLMPFSLCIQPKLT